MRRKTNQLGVRISGFLCLILRSNWAEKTKSTNFTSTFSVYKTFWAKDKERIRKMKKRNELVLWCLEEWFYLNEDDSIHLESLSRQMQSFILFKQLPFEGASGWGVIESNQHHNIPSPTKTHFLSLSFSFSFLPKVDRVHFFWKKISWQTLRNTWQYSNDWNTNERSIRERTSGRTATVVNDHIRVNTAVVTVFYRNTPCYMAPCYGCIPPYRLRWNTIT